jgi:hypothetical protein
MAAKAALVSGLMVTILAPAGTAEVLYTLVSPNEEEEGFFGYSVAGVGDVNGDGLHDVAIGAFWESPGASPDNAGRAYVFDGETGNLLHTLVSPNEEQNGEFGDAVSGAGDVDGDGYNDIIVGAVYEDPGSSPDFAGRAHVFDGSTGTPLYTLVSPNEEEGGRFGDAVSGAGDVNGDGFDDVIVGAYKEDPGSSPFDAGRAYVFDGQTSSRLHTLISPNEEVAGWFGYSVSGASDVNGDGYDDVIVGALGEDPGLSPSRAGRAYVFDGQTGNRLHTLISPNEEEYGQFGCSVSGAGDVNADEYHDVVVGAWQEDPGPFQAGAGRAYVFDGQTGSLLHTHVSPNIEWQGWFGRSVSRAGDVDGDGYDDVAIGACGESPGSSPAGAGRAYVFDGRTGNPFQTLVSPHEELSGYFGYSVSGASDADANGSTSVVVGAYRENPGTSPDDAGRAYIFSWMSLSPSVSDAVLELHWSTWSPASEYWIYGADNWCYFDPGFAPGYEYKLDEVIPPTTIWSSTNGIGDPDHNWTYLIIAVDDSEMELARTNRAGEHDFDTGIP